MANWLGAICFNTERLLRGKLESPSYFNKGHVIAASFPKVGSTYLRFLLAHTFKRLTDDPTPVDWHGINYYCPPIRGNRTLRSTADPSVAPVFLKTHFPYVPYFGKYRSIVLKRDIVPTLASYRVYLEREHGYKFRSNMQFLAHWRYGVQAYRRFYESWEGKADLYVEYDTLIRNPACVLQKIYTELFQKQLPSHVVEYAVSRSSRERMADLRKSSGDPNGKNNDYEFVTQNAKKRRVEFAESDLDFIQRNMARL